MVPSTRLSQYIKVYGMQFWSASFTFYILLLHFLIVQHAMAPKTLFDIKSSENIVWLTYDFRGLGLVYQKVMSIVFLKFTVFKVLGNLFWFWSAWGKEYIHLYLKDCFSTMLDWNNTSLQGW